MCTPAEPSTEVWLACVSCGCSNCPRSLSGTGTEHAKAVSSTVWKRPWSALFVVLDGEV